MQNSRDFGAIKSRDWMTDFSPVLIVATFIASLVAFGILKFHYLSEIFVPKLGSVGVFIAAAISVVCEAGRLAFGLAGVRDLVRGREYLGWGGILASLALTFYEHKEALRMAEHWGNSHMTMSLLFLVWVALFAEIRLIMTMSEKPEKQKSGNGERPSQNGRQLPEEAYNYS